MKCGRRAVFFAGGIVTKDALACYRAFQANDSGKQARAAMNVRYLAKLNEIFAARHSEFDLEGPLCEFEMWLCRKRNVLCEKRILKRQERTCAIGEITPRSLFGFVNSPLEKSDTFSARCEQAFRTNLYA